MTEYFTILMKIIYYLCSPDDRFLKMLRQCVETVVFFPIENTLMFIVLVLFYFAAMYPARTMLDYFSLLFTTEDATSLLNSFAMIYGLSGGEFRFYIFSLYLMTEYFTLIIQCYFIHDYFLKLSHLLDPRWFCHRSNWDTALPYRVDGDADSFRGPAACPVLLCAARVARSVGNDVIDVRGESVLLLPIYLLYDD